MADIFVSYARADQGRVAPLIAALEAQGLSVWWDPAIAGGQEFDSLITKELETARAAIVVWTESSVSSRWVRGEARMAADRGVLVPVQFGAPNLPLDARALHTIDLDDWKHDSQSAPFQDLLRALKPLLRSDAAPSTPAPSQTAAPPQSPVRTLKPWQIGAAAGAAVIAIAAALLIFAHKDAKPSAPVGASAIQSPAPAASQGSFASSRANSTVQQAPAPAKPRIAILPFENLSPDPNNAFFTDGMHEEILTALANAAPGLEVISRTTMDSYKGKPVTVEEIAKDLGCTHVIEGSVRREGDEVRVTLQLIDAKTDEHIWAQNYDRKLVSAMTLQSEVAAEVAQQLSVKLAPAAQASPAPPTKDPLAYDLYLKAQLAAQTLTGISGGASLKKVSDLYSAAIARDPDFGLAYLGRALVSSDMAQLQKDIAEARRLLGDDPRMLAGQAMLDTSTLNNAAALDLYSRAEEKGLNGSYYFLNKPIALISAGRVDDAVALARHLVTLDPANVQVLFNWSGILWMARRPAEALRAADLTIAHWPSETRVNLADYRAVLIFAFTGDLGPREAAMAAWDKAAPVADIDPEFALAQKIEYLRYEHRYADIKQAVSGHSAAVLRSPNFESNSFRSPQLVAGVRGWADLFLGDRAAAEEEGRKFLDELNLLQRQFQELRPAGVSEKTIEWLDALYTEEGELLSGEREKAIGAAKRALALMPRSYNALMWAYTASKAAAVFAWADDEDQAMALLEQLAEVSPGLAPAEIARDPIYTIPLANNARYQALKAKLDAQMAENAKLLSAAGP